MVDIHFLGGHTKLHVQGALDHICRLVVVMARLRWASNYDVVDVSFRWIIMSVLFGV